MTFFLTLCGNNEHNVIVVADAGYVDNGIGCYEYWGERCTDRRIEFECDIEKVYIVSKSGKTTREIYVNGEQEFEIIEQIKEELNKNCND